MPTKPISTVTPWIDPDDAPHLTAEHFERADWYDGDRLIRRGTSPSIPDAPPTLPLAPDLLDRLRATGPDWQARVAEVLRAWLDGRPAA